MLSSSSLSNGPAAKDSKTNADTNTNPKISRAFASFIVVSLSFALSLGLPKIRLLRRVNDREILDVDDSLLLFDDLLVEVALDKVLANFEVVGFGQSDAWAVGDLVPYVQTNCVRAVRQCDVTC